jgi:phosphate transport system substrate-binding protein
LKIDRKFLALLMAILLAAGNVLTGCGTTIETTTDGQLSGTISIAGSTTVQPLSELLAEAFMHLHPQVTITVQGGGSGVGIQSAQGGIVDIGAASRELKASEEGTVVPTVIARDGIAVVVNNTQTVSGLTMEQVRNIFAGVITNWSEVGGSNAEIAIISREEGSGTRGAFEELMMKGELITSEALLFPSNGNLHTAVSQTPDSIGFLSFGYLDGSITPLSIDGVEATTDNIDNGSYPVVRPLLYLTKSEPAGLVKDYIDFCLSAQGQAIVEEEGYLSVS